MAGWPTCWTADPSVTKFQFLDCHQLFQHLCSLLGAHLAFKSTGCAKVIMHTEDPMLIFCRRFNHLWHGAMVMFTGSMVLRSLRTLKIPCHSFIKRSGMVLWSCSLVAWCWGHCAHWRSHVNLSLREVAWYYGRVYQWHGAKVTAH